MQKYSTYKPSNVEWLGDVPTNWKVLRLKDIAKIETGNTPSKSESQNYENGTIPWIKPDGLKGGFVSTSEELISEKGLKEARLVPKNSILVGCIGDIGNFAIAGCDLTTNQQINAVIFDTTKFDYSYGKFVIELSKEEHQRNSTIVVVPILNKTRQAQIKIPIPSLTEQAAIAAYLDQATANIDQVIATKQKQLEKLEQYKQSKIHECVTKGLNPDVTLKPSGIDWIGEVPGHWRKIKLRYEIEIQSGEFVSNTELEAGGDFPVFGGNGIMGYISKFNIESERLIIGRVGAKCGNVHHVENSAWISDNALIVATYHNYRYLFYLLTEMNLNSISSQSAQPLITGTKIKNEYVVLPPIGEQIEIAEYLNDFSQKISKEKSIIEQQIEKLKQYRKSLIHECVTGKRKVTE
jgi:type I restriction enzyme S subunit